MNGKPPLIKTIHFLLISIVFAVPLFFTKQFVFGFTPEKTFLFYFLIEIAFAIWLYVALKQKAYLPPRHPLLIAGGIFLFIYTIAGVVGVSPEISFWSTISRMSGLVLLYHVGMFAVVAASTLKDKESWRKIIISTVAAGTVVALISHAQRLKTEFFSLSSMGSSTIGNTSYAGLYLLIILFLNLLLFLESTGKKKLLFGCTGLIIISSPLFFISPFGILGLARAASLSIWVGMLLTGALLITGLKRKHLKKMGIYISVLLAVILLVGAVSLFIENSPPRTFLQKYDIGSRFIFWEGAIRGVAERPVLGWGPENYFAPFYKYFATRLFTEDYAGGLEANTDKPHNAYLEIAVTGGILSLLAYFAIFISLILAIIKADRDNKIQRIHTATFGGLVVAYFLNDTFLFDTITSYIAIALVIAYVVERGSSTNDSYASISKRTRPGSLIAAFVVFLLSLNFFIYEPIVQQKTLAHIASGATVAERSGMYEDLFASTSHGRTSMALYLMTKMNVGVPKILNELDVEETEMLLSDIHNLRTAVLNHTGDDPVHYRLALSLVELTQTEYLLEKDYAKRTELLAEAEGYESILRELSPTNPQNYWIEAQRELFEGDTEAAIKLLETAKGQAPDVTVTQDFIDAAYSFKNGEIAVPLFR